MRVLALAVAMLATTPALAGSGIDPTVPANGAALNSAPIRQNFALTQKFVDGILGMWGSATAPSAPTIGQDWLNTTTSPYVWSKWDGAAWVQIATIDTSGHIATMGASMVVTYSQPATGATLTSSAGQAGYTLDPSGELATLTIALPPSPTDGWVFTVATTQTIDSLTFTGNGNTVIGGGPLGIGAGGGVAFRFRAADSTWRRSY